MKSVVSLQRQLLVSGVAPRPSLSPDDRTLALSEEHVKIKLLASVVVGNAFLHEMVLFCNTGYLILCSCSSASLGFVFPFLRCVCVPLLIVSFLSDPAQVHELTSAWFSLQHQCATMCDAFLRAMIDCLMGNDDCSSGH